MATRCRSITSLLCRWSPGCCRSTAGSVFCFAAAADYPSGDGSGSRPVCSSDCDGGFIWFIAVGHFFFPIGRTVTRTQSSFHSGSHHGPVHCGFPDQDAWGPGPVHETRLLSVPCSNPVKLVHRNVSLLIYSLKTWNNSALVNTQK